MWTKQSLRELVKERLSDYLLIIASNREPYIHTYVGDEIRCVRPASGLTTALDPVLQACGGTWIAHGSGNADHEVVDEQNKVMVPPVEPKYCIKRVWLSKYEEDKYYYGFSNEALWPLCHVAYTRPTFNESDWITYKEVNKRFAENVLEVVGNRKAFLFSHDYHLTLLPRLIKEKNQNIKIAHFWHIPWPNPETFRICPWQEEILDGLLGSDILGFHIDYYCSNFMDTVDRTMEAMIDRERRIVVRGGRQTAIRSFPISIDFEEFNRQAQQPEVDEEIMRLKRRLRIGDEFVGFGLDRYDYTKGIPERLMAVDRLLDKYPQYIGHIVYIQAGATSRIHINAYKELLEQVESLVEKINWKHGQGNWKPIIYVRELCSPLTLMAFRKMADFCVVSSLHDGMNLVAKEYVASHNDESGGLILSQFTGSARELDGALLINPYATDHFAEAIKHSLEMSERNKRAKMRKMRSIVQENNIYKWAADIISELVQFEFGE
jgi:trehalose 6-phosphate synthase